MRLVLRSFLLTLLAITFSSLNVFSQSATIATDALDYPPGSTAIITGSGFQPGETVTLQVLHYPTCCDDSTSPDHQPYTTIADANGNVSSSWYVPSDQDELGATLQLTAVGASSRLQASEVFTDGSSFGYNTTTGKSSSVSLSPGGADNSTLGVTVDAPKGNGNFNVSLSFASTGSRSITIGNASTEINVTSSTIQFITTSSAGDAHAFPVSITVGSSVAAGTYSIKATANGGGVNAGGGWVFTVVVGNTGGTIASVSVATQTGASVYGTVSSPSYSISATRGSNGSINGTYSVSGLPSGVISNFSPLTVSSSASNPIPGTTLTLSVPANLGAG